MPSKKKKAARKRAARARKSTPRLGLKMGNVGRRLLSGSLPKPHLSLTSKLGSAEGRATHIFMATGEEVIGEIRTNQGFVSVVNPQLNPGNVAFAPRLSAMASAFERYKFRELRVHYHSAAPATRSGSIGMYIDFDPSDEGPNSMVAIAENEAGAVGTVASDLQIGATWPATDPFYLMTPDLSSSGEPQWRYPGRLWVFTADSSTADDSLLAGYLSVSYVVELLRLKPVSQSVASGNVNLVETPLVTSAGDNISWGMDHLVGWWDWFNAGDASDPGSGAPSFREQLSLPAGDWSAMPLLDFLGVSMEKGKGLVSPRETRPSFSPPPGVEVSTRFRWINPLFSRDPQVRFRAVREKSSSSEEEKKLPMRPMAAGDITFNLRGRTLGGGENSLIATSTSAGATTARSVDDVFQFTLTDASRIWLEVELAAGEVRELSGGNWTVVPLEATE